MTSIGIFKWGYPAVFFRRHISREVPRLGRHDICSFASFPRLKDLEDRAVNRLVAAFSINVQSLD